MTAAMAKAPKTAKTKSSNDGGKRVGAPRAIADLLPGIGDKAFRRFGFVQSSILLRWAEIVGDRLATRSKPLSLRFPRGKQQDGTLHIAVEGAHGPIIQHASAEIIARVNGFFGYRAVTQIKLQQGRAPRTTTLQPVTAPPPREKAAPSPRAEAALRSIADPQLRAVLEELAAALAHGSTGDSSKKGG